jgi:hypothetical protein
MAMKRRMGGVAYTNPMRRVPTGPAVAMLMARRVNQLRDIGEP